MSSKSPMVRPLAGRIALVTGASRGLGRGIALQLADAGAKVYITGRQPGKSLAATESWLPTLENAAKEIRNRGGDVVIVYCDHNDDAQVERLFQQIDRENDGVLDLLVNNAYAGVTAIAEAGGRKFFECDIAMWDSINGVGLRGSYVCAVYAARMMSKRRSGLIVNVSSAGGLRYLFNVPYGVGKAAMDRMSADMAEELKSYGITVVSLWPGSVRTEYAEKIVQSGAMEAATGFSQEQIERTLATGESCEYAGKAIVALMGDHRNRMGKTGKILLTTDLGMEYGFSDVDGRKPSNMRSLAVILEFLGYPRAASIVPGCIRLPHLALHMASNKF